jgi:hypothetical protein
VSKEKIEIFYAKIIENSGMFFWHCLRFCKPIEIGDYNYPLLNYPRVFDADKTFEVLGAP